MSNNILPISALVVSYNEGHLLDKCLKTIQFCDEILIVNMGEDTLTKEVAKKYDCKIVSIEKVPLVEIVHQKMVHKLSNDWILILDPDERIDSQLQKKIISIFPYLNNKTGAIKAPMVNYFKNRMLKGTKWGGIKKKTLLFHKNRFECTTDVHRGRNVKKGFTTIEIPYEDKNVIHHYWIQNYYQLFHKHLRYIDYEGKSMYNNGYSYSIKDHILKTLNAFKYSFFDKKGYLDGFLGLFLSLFWTWYNFMAWYSLRKFEISGN